MNLWEFIFFLVRSDKSILQQLYGIRIFNKIHGYGVITKVDNERIYVSFDNKPDCRYKYKEIPQFFDNSSFDYLPISLKNELKKKNLHLRDNFIGIIFKIDEGEELTAMEINFIIEKNAYELLGKYYEKNVSDNKWHIVKAAKNYRKAGLIDKSLALTNIESINQDEFSRDNDFNKFMAALLTNHGACLRDRHNFIKAEKCAWDALEYHKSYYPYNLLGAIYIEQGKFNEGDLYFQEAVSLGSDKRDEVLNSQISFIKTIIKKASKENRIEIAKYFYHKDHSKYSFLKKFII
jgi:tetratricopeptide (TPR) repeat protein